MILMKKRRKKNIRQNWLIKAQWYEYTIQRLKLFIMKLDLNVINSSVSFLIGQILQIIHPIMNISVISSLFHKVLAWAIKKRAKDCLLSTWGFLKGANRDFCHQTVSLKRLSRLRDCLKTVKVKWDSLIFSPELCTIVKNYYWHVSQSVFVDHFKKQQSHPRVISNWIVTSLVQEVWQQWLQLFTAFVFAIYKCKHAF